MPLRDHFHPPVDKQLSWPSLHSGWATHLADHLNDHWLPIDFRAEEHTHIGPNLEIDVATFELTEEGPGQADSGVAVATLPKTFVPPIKTLTVPGIFPDTFEVRIIGGPSGPSLVAAIELISPGNKDRPEERLAFATKCASYLHHGVSVVAIDVVTERRANLHNEIMRLIEQENCDMPPGTDLYAVAYRPVMRQGQPQIDVWTAPCGLGGELPTMPLRLVGDLFVPVEFELTYEETCRRRRVP